MYVLLIILSLIIYLFYIWRNNCLYEHQSNHSSFDDSITIDNIHSKFKKIHFNIPHSHPSCKNPSKLSIDKLYNCCAKYTIAKGDNTKLLCEKIDWDKIRKDDLYRDINNNKKSMEEEEPEDPMKYAYRRIIHNTGRYKEPVYYDPDTNYYNILQSNKLKPVKTIDKVLNWTDIFSKKYKSEQLNRESEYKILKEMEDNGELDNDENEKDINVVKGEDINTNCWYNTMFNNKIINNSCSKRNTRLKEINNVNNNVKIENNENYFL